MPRVLTWAITRARLEAEALADELSSAGVRAFALPCIEREACELEPWTAAGHRVGFFTSAGAVEVVGERLHSLRFDALAALAPTTRDALKRHGLHSTIEAAAGALELARATVRHLAAQPSPIAFWYPTSDHGVTQAEQADALERLSTIGSVTRALAYRTRAPATLPGQLEALPRDYGVVFTSPSTVLHFTTARPARAPTRVACWGASTLSAARAHFPDAFALDRARPLAASLLDLENRHA